MSKAFKKKPCVYCGGLRQATTGDHVIARQFFLEKDRGNLPKAPACVPCNQEKSRLEHYLTTLLPFGARHPAATENLETQLPSRLAKNRKLHRILADSFGGAPQPENQAGSVETRVPFEGEKLELLYGFIARGLLWHEWGVLLAQDDVVYPISLAPAGEELFRQLLSMNNQKRVSRNLGNGTFIYAGAQGTDYPGFSVWEFQFYAGVMLTEGNGSSAVSLKGGVITGKSSLQPLKKSWN